MSEIITAARAGDVLLITQGTAWFVYLVRAADFRSARSRLWRE
jgi:hypothetical protein